MFNYHAFGLTFSLPFECSRLEPLVDCKNIDLEIIFSQDAYHKSPLNFEAIHTQNVYLTIESIANFHIQNGNKISIAIAPDTDFDTMMLFLFGSAFGVILYQ